MDLDPDQIARHMMSILKHPVFRSSLFLASVLLFSFFIHHPAPAKYLSIICLVIIAFELATENDMLGSLMGRSRSDSIMIASIMVALIGSVTLALHIRSDSSLSILPRTLGSFTVVAISIGAIEELLFRGWMFSQFRNKWVWPGVLFTSFAHAAYKSILFLSPYLPYQVDSMNLFLITFEAGIFLGLTRLISGSVWPALLAHSLFDLLVYGDQQVPWWVF